MPAQPRLCPARCHPPATPAPRWLCPCRALYQGSRPTPLPGLSSPDVGMILLLLELALTLTWMPAHPKSALHTAATCTQDPSCTSVRPSPSIPLAPTHPRPWPHAPLPGSSRHGASPPQKTLPHSFQKQHPLPRGSASVRLSQGATRTRRSCPQPLQGVRKQAPSLSFLVCEVRTPQHPLQGLCWEGRESARKTLERGLGHNGVLRWGVGVGSYSESAGC